MSLLLRSQVIICFLFLATMLTTSAPSSALAQRLPPTLASVSMSSSFDMVTISGTGFTENGLVRIIVQDLSDVGPTLDLWAVASSGVIDITIPYLTATTYGPNGSQDPAMGYAEGTLLSSQSTTETFGPHGSQDPAQGYAVNSMQWNGACPELLIHAWDARSDSWSNSLDVELSNC